MKKARAEGCACAKYAYKYTHARGEKLQQRRRSGRLCFHLAGNLDDGLFALLSFSHCSSVIIMYILCME